MTANYNLVPFTKDDHRTDPFFQDIDAVWKAREGGDPVAVDMKKKIFETEKEHIQKFPYLLKKDDKDVGITWVELSTPHYGNITAHVPNPADTLGLIKTLKQKGYFDDKIMELVQIHDSSQYKDACYQVGLVPNIRKRMYCWLNERDYYPEESHPFTFRPMTPDDFEWTGALSVQAHKISKDYQFYAEMNDIKKRTELEQRVWDGLYGPVIEPASLIATFNDKPVGYCYLIEVSCWGYEKVPWIFDICIDPAYHGQGIGKALSTHFLNTLMELKYEIMGLAVTLTNAYAHSMYQKFGFETLDIFYEFMEEK